MKRNSLAILVFTCSFTAVHAAEVKVSSPDDKVRVTVTDAGGLSYSVFLDGREVVGKSRFGVVADGVDLGADARLGKSSSRRIRESYPMFGGHSRGENNCLETTVSVRGAGGEVYELDVRAYNHGVALRSRLAPRAGRKINGESTEWKMTGNPLAWFQTDFGSYEGIFQSSRLEGLSGTKIPLPITFSLPGGGYALVTEANLLNYTDLGVQVSEDHSLRAYFHARQDRDGFTTDDAVVQPWRVTLLARDLNALANSDLVRNLCPASSELSNAAWIQP
ncbi:MAG TPA: glycoside hydrolase family 97 N-terminal domain-containing protein, partial [Candidatus Binatus sp.]|nr:glycoside hydrolase family 97 N-terminal domain-containing protein [Candidatus Binatus sp.]